MTTPTASKTKKALNKLKAELEALREENQRLSAMAYRDPLTGLRNRRFFMERLGEELGRRRRGKGTELSVLMVDLNGFKALNDTMGHAAGDAALCAVARFLESLTRATDACCRVGGDEFVVLLPDTDAEQCERVLERVRNHVEALHAVGLTGGLALGAATADRIDDELRLLSRADDSMYADKRSTKSGVMMAPAVAEPASFARAA